MTKKLRFVTISDAEANNESKGARPYFVLLKKHATNNVIVDYHNQNLLSVHALNTSKHPSVYLPLICEDSIIFPT